MISPENIRILMQYISALEEASATLDKMYLDKNIEGFEKTKRFILDIQSKMSVMLKN